MGGAITSMPWHENKQMTYTKQTQQTQARPDALPLETTASAKRALAQAEGA